MEPRRSRGLETELASGLELSSFGDVVPGGVHGASVLARWRLTYPGKPEASGMTLLVLRPRPGAPDPVLVSDVSDL